MNIKQSKDFAISKFRVLINKYSSCRLKKESQELI